MTLIAAAAFPDEIIIMSDSRASYRDPKIPPKDKLKKVFQLNTHSMLAYTTEDVGFTSKLIEVMTIKAKKVSGLKFKDFLNEISTYAIKSYSTISKKQPRMDFIYAGLDFESSLKIKSSELRIILQQCEKKDYYPDKLHQATYRLYA